MSVKIASLVAELTAETASFHRDMGKAVSALSSDAAAINRSLAKVDGAFRSLGFTIAAVAGPAAVGAFIKSQVNLGDQLNKTSQKLGVSVEKMSAYQYAAKLANVDNESLTTSLARLGKAMAEGLADPTSKTATAFKNLGISLKDAQGNVRPLDQIFEEVARKLAKVPDGAVKIQYEMALLGKSGYELAPLLKGLDDLVTEAQRAGKVISTDFAQSSEMFNDNLTRMQTSAEALGRSLVSNLLPAMNDLIERANVAFGVQESLSLKVLSSQRAKLADEYVRLTNAGLSESSARAISIRKQIDEVDAKIIEANRKLLELRSKPGVKEVGGDKGLAALPPLAKDDTERRAREEEKRAKEALKRENELAEINARLRADTARTQAAMTDDTRLQAQYRFQAAVDAMEQEIKEVENKYKVNLKMDETYTAWYVAQVKLRAYESRTETEKLMEQWQNVTKQMEQANARWWGSAVDQLTDFVMTGKASFKDFANSIIRDIVRIALQSQIAGIFTGRGGGGIVNLLFGATATATPTPAPRADGGPVNANQPYWVGERGVPELFVPSTSGMVIPESQLGGGAQVSTTYVFEISTGVQDTVRAEIMAMMPLIEMRTRQSVFASIDRGGNAARTVGRRT